MIKANGAKWAPSIWWGKLIKHIVGIYFQSSMLFLPIRKLFIYAFLIINILFASQFVHQRKTAFEKRFETCKHYPFVRKFQDTITASNHSKYLIFVFHEPGQRAGAGGGLGDRLGGMLTAFAYSLRTNRTFLIEADPALSSLFRPHFAKDVVGTMNLHDASWGNWSWLGWNKASDIQKTHCVNPRPKQVFCALDDATAHSSARVVKYFGNRSYLCRWMIQGHATVLDSLWQSLGINALTNLYHAAGCMLRLILWPTDHMWRSIDKFYGNISSTPTVLSDATNLIGVHFRCGDSSFSQSHSSVPNPQCYFNASIPWQGTTFSDDKSMDSPIDLAKCVNRYLRSGNQSAVYVASDNYASARQIVDNLETSNILIPTDSCHIDLQQNCAENTLVQWFALSLADRIVTQALIPPPISGYTDPQRNDDIHAPISAFSKYAFIYSLSSRHLLYGNCTDVDSDLVARHTHGNWVCNPRTFFRP